MSYTKTSSPSSSCWELRLTPPPPSSRTATASVLSATTSRTVAAIAHKSCYFISPASRACVWTRRTAAWQDKSLAQDSNVTNWTSPCATRMFGINNVNRPLYAMGKWYPTSNANAAPPSRATASGRRSSWISSSAAASSPSSSPPSPSTNLAPKRRTGSLAPPTTIHN